MECFIDQLGLVSKKFTQEGIILRHQQTFAVIQEAIYSNNIHHTIQQTLTQTWFSVEQHLEFRSGSSEVMIWSDTQIALQAPVTWLAVDIIKFTTNTAIIKQAEKWKSFQIRKGVLKMRVITFKTCFQAEPWCLPSAGIDGHHYEQVVVYYFKMQVHLTSIRSLFPQLTCTWQWWKVD